MEVCVSHIIKRKNRYHYNRRVPLYLREFDPREHIRFSLKTESKEEAERRASMFDQQLEAYWQKLILTGEKYAETSYKRAVELSRQWGFVYKEASLLSQNPLEDLYNRLKVIDKNDSRDTQDILLGQVPKPDILLSDCFSKFLPLINDRLLNKSSNQIRKWKNPRLKAINNLTGKIGDKKLGDLNREDLISFRDWWIDRIKIENMTPNSANKDIGHLRDVIEVVNDHYQLGINTTWLFNKLSLKNSFRTERLPFTSEHITNVLLDAKNLANLNKEARLFLHIMAETGARGSELVELREEDIVIDHDIPHIKIHDRKTRKLKTPYSNRDIPLVGFALEAFQALPDGFTQYRDRFDSLSALLNKYLKHHNLLPSENHTVYSLRHSFQDRLTNVNTPDRVQAQLMGHKFNRPEYGKGASLELKKEWLEKTCLKPLSQPNS